MKLRFVRWRARCAHFAASAAYSLSRWFIPKKNPVPASSKAPVNWTLPRTGSTRRSPGSNAFVPSVAGLILAGEVVRDLAGCPRKGKEKRRAP